MWLTLTRAVIRKGYFQATLAVWFLGAHYVAITQHSNASYRWGGAFALGAAGLSYLALLTFPSRPYLRLSSLVLPALASMSRALDFVTNEPILWSGFTAWLLITWVVVVVAPTFLPPPLSNGRRREYLADGRGPA